MRRGGSIGHRMETHRVGRQEMEGRGHGGVGGFERNALKAHEEGCGFVGSVDGCGLKEVLELLGRMASVEHPCHLCGRHTVGETIGGEEEGIGRAEVGEPHDVGLIAAWMARVEASREVVARGLLKELVGSDFARFKALVGLGVVAALEENFVSCRAELIDAGVAYECGCGSSLVESQEGDTRRQLS